MLDQQPEKMCTINGACFPLLGLAIAVAKCYRYAVIANELFFANDPAVKIARQILQRGQTIANGATIDYPILGQ